MIVCTFFQTRYDATRYVDDTLVKLERGDCCVLCAPPLEGGSIFSKYLGKSITCKICFMRIFQTCLFSLKKLISVITSGVVSYKNVSTVILGIAGS